MGNIVKWLTSIEADKSDTGKSRPRFPSRSGGHPLLPGLVWNHCYYRQVVIVLSLFQFRFCQPIVCYRGGGDRGTQFSSQSFLGKCRYFHQIKFPASLFGGRGASFSSRNYLVKLAWIHKVNYCELYTNHSQDKSPVYISNQTQVCNAWTN